MQLHRRLLVGHVTVEEEEVVDEHRHGEPYHQDAGQRAERPDQVTQVGRRVHVTITDCSHGNDGPPEALGYVREVFVSVGEVDE